MNAPANAVAAQPEHLPAVAAQPRTLAVHSDEAIAPAMAPAWLTPQSMEAALHLAEMMAKAKLVPEHLRGSPGDCLLVVSQAARWGIDPFAVAQATAVVRGKLCYEGKLVATVLRATGAISGHLTYAFTGAGQGMSVTVTGTPRGGTPQSLTRNVLEVRTENKMWDTDPQSMLVYRVTRQWARLYAPQAMLGVMTPDEAEEIKDAVVLGGSPGVTPTAPPAPPAAPPTPTKTVEQQVTDEYADLRKLAGKDVAGKIWKHFGKDDQRQQRLDAMRAANAHIRKITVALGAKADGLLAQILTDREKPDDVVGILADLATAAGLPDGVAAGEQPPH